LDHFIGESVSEILESDPKISYIIFIFIIIIFILEIASLAVFTFHPTAVGIWCVVPFLAACILTFILDKLEKRRN
jgi:hypothetical protein